MMKKVNGCVVVCGLVVVMFGVLALVGDAGADSTYIGELCWSVNIGEIPMLLKFGVTDTGGGHFLMNGMTNALGIMVPALGAATVDADGTKIRVNYTWQSPFIGSPTAKQMFESGNLIVSSSTGNGTAELLDTLFDPGTGKFTQTHLTGTATLYACP
jgi:hypothetical protein